MTVRSTSYSVNFRNDFHLPGHADTFPPGHYDILVEEELLDGLSFPAFRETAAYLLVPGRRPGTGPAEMRQIHSADLRQALDRDAQTIPAQQPSDGGPDSTTPAQGRNDEGRWLRWKRWTSTLASLLPR